MRRLELILVVAILTACGGASTASSTSSVPPSSPTTSTTLETPPASLADARGEIDACAETIASDFASTASGAAGFADPESAVRSALAAAPVDWGTRYAEAAGVQPLDGSPSIFRVLAPGPEFELTVAVVQAVERGGGDWAAVSAIHCSEPDLPYPRPGESRGPGTRVSLLPADDSLAVTATPLAMSVEALQLLDGMLVDGIGHVLLQGDPAARPFILRVEDGAAEILRGAWCATWSGPASLDDGRGGAVVLSDRPSLVRCRPGSDVFDYGEVTPIAMGMVGGRRVIAALSGVDEPEVVAIDVEDGTRAPLFGLEASSLRSLSFGGGRWLVGAAGSYTVLSADGAIDSTAVAPPWAPGTPGTRVALSDDGRRALRGGVDGDEFVLTVWDLESGLEQDVIRIAGAHDFVYIDSVDLASTRAIVNLGAVNGERHPAAVLIVDFDTGEVTMIDPGWDILSFAPLGITRVVDVGLPWLQIGLASFLEN